MSGRRVLVTGATGTFGRAFLRRVIQDRLWDTVVAFSRDEVKQAAVRQEFDGEPKMFLGDVRDSIRLGLAMRGVDTVVHAAALKRVDAGAYSPSEIIATNVLGTMNVVNAAIHERVPHVIVLSSDKCVNATNIYGASKYLAECYAVQANAYGYPSGTRVAAVRYGNILGSRGSVVGIWRDQLARRQPITLTDRRMSRFIMTIEQAVELVLFAHREMRGGEVFVPLLPSARMGDLAQAIVWPETDYPIAECGMRPGGEKIAESLLNEEEPCRTRQYKGRYVIAPSQHDWTTAPAWPGILLKPGFSYRSDGNAQQFLEPGDLRDLMERTEACR
jgi:UDP-N-acetylglucosamine 4,6-dehydratase/5-epimerase